MAIFRFGSMRASTPTDFIVSSRKREQPEDITGWVRSAVYALGLPITHCQQCPAADTELVPNSLSKSDQLTHALPAGLPITHCQQRSTADTEPVPKGLTNSDQLCTHWLSAQPTQR